MTEADVKAPIQNGKDAEVELEPWTINIRGDPGKLSQLKNDHSQLTSLKLPKPFPTSRISQLLSTRMAIQIQSVQRSTHC
jgi:hypothetical protein